MTSSWFHPSSHLLRRLVSEPSAGLSSSCLLYFQLAVLEVMLESSSYRCFLSEGTGWIQLPLCLVEHDWEQLNHGRNSLGMEGFPWELCRCCVRCLYNSSAVWIWGSFLRPKNYQVRICVQICLTQILFTGLDYEKNLHSPANIYWGFLSKGHSLTQPMKT